MSVDFNVYVGPYLDIREPVTRSTVDYCAGHGRDDAASYCPKCARPKDRRYGESDDGAMNPGFWNHRDWLDHLVCTTCEENIVIDGLRTVRAVHNGSRFGKWLCRDDDTAAHAIPTAEGFAEALASEIARIREIGCSVEVKLGVLVWYS